MESNQPSFDGTTYGDACLPEGSFAIIPATRFYLDRCAALVRVNWGHESAQRCLEQFVEGLNGGKYDPMFFVCTTGHDKVVGFSALRRSMLMSGGWEFIWVAVDEDYQGRGVGTLLMDHRLDLVRRMGGSFVELVTQKPRYFNRFSFVTTRHLGNGWMKMMCRLKLVDMNAL